MRMQQDSSCSCSLGHCSGLLAFWVSIFWALAFLLSVGTPWRLSLGCFWFLLHVFLRTFLPLDLANDSYSGAFYKQQFGCHVGFWPTNFFGYSFVGYRLFQCPPLLPSPFHRRILLTLFHSFRRFVTSDFGGFAKSPDVFWLDYMLFGVNLASSTTSSSSIASSPTLSFPSGSSTGNIVVPSFVSTYCTLGKSALSIPAIVGAPSLLDVCGAASGSTSTQRSTSSFLLGSSIPLHQFLGPHHRFIGRLWLVQDTPQSQKS